jgi:hypothetical protein
MLTAIACAAAWCALVAWILGNTYAEYTPLFLAVAATAGLPPIALGAMMGRLWAGCCCGLFSAIVMVWLLHPFTIVHS